MTGPTGDLWLVLQLARQSLECGTLRGYWPGLARHGAGRGVVTRGLAAVVWVALVPLVPVLAARRRRLIARALEGVVRAMVAGVDGPKAVHRAVALLERKGIEPVQARADLERLLSGFLSAPFPAHEGAASRADRSRLTRAG